MVKEYLKKLEELKILGEKLMEEATGEENWYDEIENMDLHLECAERILKKGGKIK